MVGNCRINCADIIMRFLLLLLCLCCYQSYALKCRYPKRIISLAPNLTEMVYRVGAGKQLVAVDTGSDYPKVVKRLPKVASYHGLDLEKIIALHPDLVLAWQGGNPQLQLNQIKRLGIKVAEFNPLHLSQIPVTLRKVGCLTGHEWQAKSVASDFKRRFQDLQRHYQHQSPVTVFVQMNAQPLLTLTSKSLLNDMIEACGGVNIFANLVGVAPRVSIEAVLQAKPHAMIGTNLGWQFIWQKWQSVPAVKMHNMFTVKADYLYRATYRSLMGLKNVCHALSLARSRSSR